MTELGGGIDELDDHLFHHALLVCGVQRFTQSDDSLLGTHTTALDHDEVVVDLSVVRETAHWGDVLHRQIVVGTGITLDLGDVRLSFGLLGFDTWTNR